MRNAPWMLRRAVRLAAAVVVTGLTACGGTTGGDTSPIPSTGVPMAARDARGVKVADHATPMPTPQGEEDPFGAQPHAVPNVVPTVHPMPPPDPFGAPPDAPLAPPPPKPPSTGVPL